MAFRRNIYIAGGKYHTKLYICTLRLRFESNERTFCSLHDQLSQEPKPRDDPIKESPLSFPHRIVVADFDYTFDSLLCTTVIVFVECNYTKLGLSSLERGVNVEETEIYQSNCHLDIITLEQSISLQLVGK